MLKLKVGSTSTRAMVFSILLTTNLLNNYTVQLLQSKFYNLISTTDISLSNITILVSTLIIVQITATKKANKLFYRTILSVKLNLDEIIILTYYS
jgi:hypothetical protein